MKDEQLRKVVSEKYGKAAVAAGFGAKASCCEPSCGGGSALRGQPIEYIKKHDHCGRADSNKR